ncbi:hypothetical protein BD310DRAFT_932695 [Dichomitus squalens]|uniref:DUF7770 domain-containing protein n=1 Tax=Dichomitus squalens TaxID=114155 RepID=A0A4Q9PNX3_9APHY|nr:hypothetical protein BD310DRAFT_932695 [Dichomitus squalens]
MLRTHLSQHVDEPRQDTSTMAATIYDKALRPVDKDRRVTQITVTASLYAPAGSEGVGIFHWRLYLVLGPDRVSTSRAVLLDMVPTNPPFGTLIIASKDNAHSNALIKIELPIASVDGLTVRQVIDLIVSNRMDRYKFDASGSGCLFWIWNVLQQLQNARLVEDGAVAKLQDFHAEQARLQPGKIPLPLRRGEFY